MNLQILLSCMHQSDVSIIERSNIQTDVVVVNQCDKDSVEDFEFLNKQGRTCKARFVCTTERGLSKSRNMAIRNAWGDICLLSDDDEFFAEGCEGMILSVYERNPNADLIAFALENEKKVYPRKVRKMGFKQILKTSSVQITFKRTKVMSNEILFDEKMGSGTGNGGGEENKFLLDCRKKGFSMWYNPCVIGKLNTVESQWFHGYTPSFSENLGWSTRRWGGVIIGYAFIWWWALSHQRIYKKDNLSFFSAIKNLHKGFFQKR